MRSTISLPLAAMAACLQPFPWRTLTHRWLIAQLKFQGSWNGNIYTTMVVGLAAGTPGCHHSRTAQRQILSEDLAHEIEKRIEAWLDQGFGRCLLKQSEHAAHLTAAIHHFDGRRYELGCYVVMPNHAHAIVRPISPESNSVEDIVGSWKKYSSRRINQELRREQEFWQEESYDRIIRDEEHLWQVIQYIAGNPAKAGLSCESCSLWIRPEWVQLGWRFEAMTGS